MEDCAVVKAVLADITAMKQFQNAVSEVGDTLTCVSEARSQQIDTGAQMQLQHAKEKYSMLRKKVTALQLRIQMQENIRQGQQPKIPQEELLKGQSHAVDAIKEEITKTKQHINELANETAHYYALYTEKLEILKTKIEQLEAKVERFKLLSSKEKEMPELLSQMKSEEDAESLKKTLESDLAVVKAEREALRENVKNEQTAIQEAEEALRQVRGILAELDGQLDSQMEVWTDRQEEFMGTVTWLEGAIECLHTYSGIESILIEGTSLIVRFLGDAEDEELGSAESTALLQLTISFAPKRGHFSLVGAQVDLYYLDITDLVSVAVQRDDLDYLVTQVSARWRQVVALQVELEQLRDRYALDWIAKEDRVQVLYGDDGHIVCTLHLEPGYPRNGRVILEKISGLPEGKTVDDYQSLPSGARLSQWLEYFHQCFDGTPSHDS